MTYNLQWWKYIIYFYFLKQNGGSIFFEGKTVEVYCFLRKRRIK